MVRLVFRPYTQLGRSICTSESLRSSTRVSPGFDLVRHRSPSFGSQRVGSVSVPRTRSTRGTPPGCARSVRDGISGRGKALTDPTLLSLRLAGFVFSRRLAHMLDSLVRVSRRVGWDPTTTSLLCRLPMVGERQVTAERTDGKRGARKARRPKPPIPPTTPTPYVRHPAGRRVLLGRMILGPPRQAKAPRAGPPHGGTRTLDAPTNNNQRPLTVRPSRAHPFNPLDGFTHY